MEETKNIHEADLPTMFIAGKADMAKTKAKLFQAGYPDQDSLLLGMILRYPDYTSGNDSVKGNQGIGTSQDEEHKLIDATNIRQEDNDGSSYSPNLAEDYPSAETIADHLAQKPSPREICPIRISWQGKNNQGFFPVLKTVYADTVNDNNTWTIR